uniref:SET domain-containing protein n=1 Tax=Otolemur garnettii TaxID=30611 RepID=H0XJN8_OTOGA
HGASPDLWNKEGITAWDLTPKGSDVWCALQLNCKLQLGAIGTEKIICWDMALGYKNVPVPCVNGEPCPDYTYISQNCETSIMNVGHNIPPLWHYKDGWLLQEFNEIFQCNQVCSCKLKEPRHAERHKGTAETLRNSQDGLGVCDLQTIPQGTFICKHVGELICNAEADVIEDDSYLSNLDNKDGEVYCIDAGYYSNTSCFINHSYDLNILPVWVVMLHQDLQFPHIAFSSRHIWTGEELGFDYGDRFCNIKIKYFTC